MKLKALDMDIATGGPLIATMNYDDAAKLDLHEMDRIKIINSSYKQTRPVSFHMSKTPA